MKRVHIVLREQRIGRYACGYEVVSVYDTRKAAVSEAKRLNASPQARHYYEVKSKLIIRVLE